MPPPNKRKRDLETAEAMEDSAPVSSKSKRGRTAYTTQQKTAISQITGATGLDRTAAAKLLKQHGWNIEIAANAHFSGGTNVASNPHKAPLTKLFDKYRDDPQNEPDEIDVQGTMKMCEDMEVSIEEVSFLIFSELVQSPTMGKLTRENFVDGLSAAGVSEPAKIRNLVLQRQSQLTSPAFKSSFKNIYRHTFVIARAQGQKAVALDVATEYWRLLFTSPSIEWKTATTPWLDWWNEFLETRYKKSVNKDMWDQTLSFAQKCLEDESLNWWSEDSAWPGVIDEFVEFVQKDKRGGGEAMEVE
ncbi:hypothetical protein MBLNU459_g4709t1 [Dothideomycetes sp. NU459]